MRNSPGCNCCGVRCDIVDMENDLVDDKFTVLAGSWTIYDGLGTPSNQYLQPTGAPAAIATNVAAEAGLPWIAQAEFSLGDVNATTFWRLGVGTDVDNYVFVEVRATLLSGTFYLQMQLGERVSGTDSYSAEAPYSATELGLQSGGELDVGLIVTLCWDEEGTLSATIVNQTDSSKGIATISKVGVSSLGVYAGVFLQSGPGAGSFRVQAFYFGHSFDETETPSCAECASSCAAGLPLEEFSIEISDASPATFSLSAVGVLEPLPACTFDCADIVGTYVVSQSKLDKCSESNMSGTNRLGDNFCRWRSEPVDLDSSCVSNPSHTDDLRLVATMAADPGDPYSSSRILTIEAWYRRSTAFQSECFLIASFQGTIDVAMENWVVDEWIDVAELGTTYCNTSSTLQARVKRNA